MKQLEIFEQEDYYRQDLKVKQQLTEYQEKVLLGYYVNEYIEKMGYAHKVDNKWYYTEDRYKLLHYLLEHAEGKKQSIAGWELSNYMFNNKNTEKLRDMIRELRNDINVSVIIGSSPKGYFIAKHDELYDAIKYLFGKSVNEMITVIRMFPSIFESYIKIAQKTYQATDKACDRQVTAQFENDTENIINEIVIRFADTMKKESKK
jgi:hypothetical protein